MSDSATPPPPTEIPPEVRRRRFLFTNLVIISLFAITLVFLIFSYPTLLSPGPTPTPLRAGTRFPTATYTPTAPTSTVTPTPTVTRTPLDTFTPTVTLTPTRTSSPTPPPTPPGPPTLTPARPKPVNALYSLNDWTPEDADHAILLMEDYPNLLAPSARGEDGSGYYAAFTFAITALREALLRFPDAPQADAWKWRLAYDLARISDPQSGAVYADLISSGLNRDETSVEDLADWLKTKEPRLELNVTDLKPPSGYLGAHLLEVRGEGSAFIWLLENPGAYQAQALLTNFDFVHPPDMQAVSGDLTGDSASGAGDLALYNAQPESGFPLLPPRVFNLENFPASELPFLPGAQSFPLGVEFENHWEVAPGQNGQSDLLFHTTVFPSCPVTIQARFHWNGQAFNAIPPTFTVEPNQPTLNTCPVVVAHAQSAWGPAAAAQIMENLLPFWPPPLDPQGEAYPADARDEWRYQLGVQQALAGDFEAAHSTLQALATFRTVPGSQWVEPAQAFLAAYQEPADLYRACVQSSECDPEKALATLINSLPERDFPDAVERLTGYGVSLRSSGFFDFDRDEISERWFMLRHRPLEKPVLWILTTTRHALRAIPMGTLDSSKPSFSYVDEKAENPVVSVNDLYGIQLKRDPLSGEPVVETSELQLGFPNRFKLGLQAAEDALWAGKDSRDVRNQIRILQEFPGLVCRGTYTCDPYWYLLGLANELAGDERAAVDAYLELWNNYSRSPYTTLARLKLSGGGISAPVTPPATLAPAPTSGITPVTPTVGTAVPTSTEEAYPPPSPYPYP